MSYDPNMPDLPERLPRSTAAEKVNLPGIFLMIVGILNVLGALFILFQGVSGLTATPADVAKTEREMTPEQRKQLEEAGYSPEKLAKMARDSAPVTLAWGVLALIAAVVTILAGVKMRALQSRGLVTTGAILAMIPCISPLGCCLIGQAVGIWSLITASSADVKAAFRS